MPLFAVFAELAREQGQYGESCFAFLSIVGDGMKSHSGVAFKMFDILAANKINIEKISTSEIKISVVIRAGDADRAVRALHDTFGLSRKPKAKAPAKKAKAPAKTRG